MNRRIGMIASLVTLFSVIVFALAMLINQSTIAYSICILLAGGYIVMTGAFSAYAKKDMNAAAQIGVAFAVVYAVFVMIVYYAQVTTVRLGSLSEETLYLLDYEKFGLFFSYDLFGYGMLAVSTFFVGLTITSSNKEAKILKWLLLIHGIFSVVCFIPALGVFQPGMAGGDIIGIAVLEVWCLYFIPVCYYSYQYFKHQN